MRKCRLDSQLPNRNQAAAVPLGKTRLYNTISVACRLIYDCLIAVISQTENEVAQELQAVRTSSSLKSSQRSSFLAHCRRQKKVRIVGWLWLNGSRGLGRSASVFQEDRCTASLWKHCYGKLRLALSADVGLGGWSGKSACERWIALVVIN